MKKLSAKDIEEMNDSGTVLYVRWSRGARYDKKPSHDFVSGHNHTGLSAVKIGNWGDDYMIQRLSEYRFLRIKDDRINAYIYTGTEIGKDSDGYSLLEVSSIRCIGRWTEK